MNSVFKHFCKPSAFLHAAGNRQLSDFINRVKFQPNVYDSKRFKDLYYKKCTLVSADRLKAWRGHFPEIVKDLIAAPGMEEITDKGLNSWIQDVVNYNTPHGKGIRALQVLLADKYLGNDTSAENVKTVNALAWLMELLQAAACVVDDILDESETRRDRLCWFKVNKQGLAAYNDYFLLSSAPFILLKGRDVRNAKLQNYETYNLEFYNNMMMFKNGFYTFYIPVATAMFKNGIRDKAILKEVEKLSLDVGLIYSIQDDFMDCFVDSKLTGKIGTDIQEGKFTWLFVNALEKCSAEQRQVLLGNYGSRDQAKVDVVKGLYRDIGIPQMFKSWEEEVMTRTLTDIGQLSLLRLQPLFYDLIASLCGRVR